MKIIDLDFELENNDFEEHHLFWNWINHNLSDSTWNKLRIECFKDVKLWRVSDEFEELRR